MVFDDKGRARGTLTVQGLETGKEAEMTVVSDGTTAYMTSDLLESLPEGKTWMELNFSSAAKGLGSSAPVTGGPQEGLKVLERVQGAEEIGKQNIDGVPTTRYRGTLPTSKEVFGVKLHVSELHVDVWIDAKDRVRRMQMTVSGALGKSATSTTEMNIDFVDFGRVPKIEFPHPDEVFDATSEVESQVQSAAERH